MVEAAVDMLKGGSRDYVQNRNLDLEEQKGILLPLRQEGKKGSQATDLFEVIKNKVESL